MTSLLECDNQLVAGRASKHLPGHLDVAVGRKWGWGRKRGLGERATERPEANNIPLVDLGQSLQFDEPIPSSLRDVSPLYGWFHVSITKSILGRSGSSYFVGRVVIGILCQPIRFHAGRQSRFSNLRIGGEEKHLVTGLWEVSIE